MVNKNPLNIMEKRDTLRGHLCDSTAFLLSTRC